MLKFLKKLYIQNFLERDICTNLKVKVVLSLVFSWVPLLCLVIGILLAINAGKNLAYKRHDLVLIQATIADKVPTFKEATARFVTLPLTLAYLFTLLKIVLNKIGRFLLKVTVFGPIKFLQSGHLIGVEDIYGPAITTVSLVVSYIMFSLRAKKKPSEPLTIAGKLIYKGLKP